MPLPVIPEPIEQIRSRYRAAISRTFDVANVDTDRPGLYRECVFDYPDGLRLIAGRFRLDTGATIIHVSASISKDSAMQDQFVLLAALTPEKVVEVWVFHVLDQIVALTGADPCAIKFNSYEDGILSVLIQEGNPDAN